MDLSSYMNWTSEPGSPTGKKCFTSSNINDLDTYKSKQSPGIKQYNAIRASLEPNTILLLQNGAFYEMYDGDGIFGVEFLGLKGVKK